MWPEIITIFGGILTVVSGIVIREFLLWGNKQKVVIHQLLAYTEYYFQTIVENEILFNMAHPGLKWSKDFRDALEKGESAERLAEINQSYENDLLRFRDAVADQSPDSGFDRNRFLENVKLLDPVMDSLLNHLKQGRQDVVEGSSFIRDADAAALGGYFASEIIKLKMRIIAFLASTELVLRRAHYSENPELSLEPEELYAWKRNGVLLIKQVDWVTYLVRPLQAMSIFQIAKKNLLGRAYPSAAKRHRLQNTDRRGVNNIKRNR